MKKHFKQILTVFTCTTLLLTLIPATGFAAAVSKSNKTSDVLRLYITEINQTKGGIVITEEYSRLYSRHENDDNTPDLGVYFDKEKREYIVALSKEQTKLLIDGINAGADIGKILAKILPDLSTKVVLTISTALARFTADIIRDTDQGHGVYFAIPVPPNMGLPSVEARKPLSDDETVTPAPSPITTPCPTAGDKSKAGVVININLRNSSLKIDNIRINSKDQSFSITDKTCKEKHAKSNGKDKTKENKRKKSKTCK